MIKAKRMKVKIIKKFPEKRTFPQKTAKPKTRKKRKQMRLRLITEN